MSFDVRTPIGLLFLAIGAVVAAYGAVVQPTSGGVNIDLAWGAVMVLFGVAMLALARLARRGEPPRPGG